MWRRKWTLWTSKQIPIQAVMRSSISSDPPMTNVAVFELGLPWDAVSLLSKGEQLLGEKKTNQTWHPSVTSTTSNISRCLNGSLTKHHAFHFCWHSNHPLRSYVIIFSSSSFLQRKNTRMNQWCKFRQFSKKDLPMEGISESQASPNGEITWDVWLQ